MRHDARPRTRHRAAGRFFLTTGFCLLFATYALLIDPYLRPPPAPSIHPRSLDAPVSIRGEDDCRRVHNAHDQCAFIRANCPPDEGGFTAYLELFYCRLPHAKPVAFLILISWLGLLFSTIGIAASDFFCIDLSTIAGILGMSESMAGVTFLAFGNGSPDVFSTFAAMSTNSGSLAVGELFGAAGFITAVVAGAMALIRPFHVSKNTFIRDVGFFAVAAAFSMVFLWDGRLHFWECVTMVIYYIFYVVFVVAWHWWVGRRRLRREKEAAARGHFVNPEEDELDHESYHDDPAESHERRRPSIFRAVSREDWSALEGGSAEPYEDAYNEDEEEEARDRWMSDLSSNMRLTRPNARSRRNTVTPVRPSLVGALEFQAVLKSLQKSRNIQTIPLDSRRYSDDPTYTTLQQQDQMSSVSDPAARPAYEVHVTDESSPLLERPSLDIPTPYSAPPGRTRAVSANDAATLRLSTHFPSLTPIQSEDNIPEGPGEQGQRPGNLLEVPIPAAAGSHPTSPTSPALTIEPATPGRESTFSETRSRASTASGDLLAPPEPAPFNRPSSDYFVPRPPSRQATDSPEDSPRLVPRARMLPKIVIPQNDRSPPSSRGTSPFPAYRDYPSPSITASTRSPAGTRPPSLYLRGPVSPESLPADQAVEQEVPRRPSRLTKFWPYKLLPPPGVIMSTLLPTIYHWHEKSWWEKILGIVAAPSVFLLTITLPVVEAEKDEVDDVPTTPAKNLSLDSARSKSAATVTTVSPGPKSGIIPEYLLDGPDEQHHEHNLATEGVTGLGNTATVAAHAEQHRQHPNQHVVSAEPHVIDEGDDGQPELWNRWLTIIQLLLAPIFIVLSIYIQAPTDLTPFWLVRSILICLLVSVVLLIPFLLTTTPTHRPNIYRIILSLSGFVVSIAWISAVASQVVGALKALAVILNMSHAIMGLTIFAVGNSLGDLVADVTVAKLGYPVMALSACFGGPMLNILLGVGLSGSYMLIRGAERRHEKHPEKGIKFHSYHIEVSKTLIVSGITLLITLVGLLILVPLNRWVLNRKIAWAMIALWTISTIFNVIVEVTGILGESAR
ncbi:hypothetical protein PRZ48_008696 [Zasmidium cellare]|uniref:Sodium/calcium exchanger membrane region domain-containing protein n=1 Tax=Zasmidium cellare TaxID=395010 RepID=A0ABR0EG67_ZASCE|nr:hypothetical protein PRZ48_008696 [Zasmidium cellare]